MIEFIAVNMAPIMFASLIVFLLLGYPVAFALAANGLLFFVVGVELAPLSGGTITLSWPLLYALPERFFRLPINGDAHVGIGEGRHPGEGLVLIAEPLEARVRRRAAFRVPRPGSGDEVKLLGPFNRQ